ncbi:MAG: hypothetical protein KKA79_00880 [Nanoarchaeota archaeon]|nr:hypothetical protein [Nanoarchaeota archaeon]MCG2717708.1 hypothetical protein [Nanoarchaeota archaeon]
MSKYKVVTPTENGERKRCCSDCVVYKYQNNLPDRITTQRQRCWDTVMSICCRTCNQHSNFMCNLQTHTNVIDDVFIKKLEILLRNKLGYAKYRKEKERMMEESEWIKKI